MTLFIRRSGKNGYGSTHWTVSMTNRPDGVPGQFIMEVVVMASREGLTVGGVCIPWEELNEAQDYALQRKKGKP